MKEEEEEEASILATKEGERLKRSFLFLSFSSLMSMSS
jgi:hypothetical protein